MKGKVRWMSNTMHYAGTPHSAPHMVHLTQCTSHGAPHTVHLTRCTSHSARTRPGWGCGYRWVGGSRGSTLGNGAGTGWCSAEAWGVWGGGLQG